MPRQQDAPDDTAGSTAGNSDAGSSARANSSPLPPPTEEHPDDSAANAAAAASSSNGLNEAAAKAARRILVGSFIDVLQRAATLERHGAERKLACTELGSRLELHDARITLGLLGLSPSNSDEVA